MYSNSVYKPFYDTQKRLYLDTMEGNQILIPQSCVYEALVWLSRGYLQHVSKCRMQVETHEPQPPLFGKSRMKTHYTSTLKPEYLGQPLHTTFMDAFGIQQNQPIAVVNMPILRSKKYSIGIQTDNHEDPSSMVSTQEISTAIPPQESYFVRIIFQLTPDDQVNIQNAISIKEAPVILTPRSYEKLPLDKESNRVIAAEIGINIRSWIDRYLLPVGGLHGTRCDQGLKIPHQIRQKTFYHDTDDTDDDHGGDECGWELYLPPLKVCAHLAYKSQSDKYTLESMRFAEFHQIICSTIHRTISLFDQQLSNREYDIARKKASKLSMEECLVLVMDTFRKVLHDGDFQVNQHFSSKKPLNKNVYKGQYMKHLIDHLLLGYLENSHDGRMFKWKSLLKYLQGWTSWQDIKLWIYTLTKHSFQPHQIDQRTSFVQAQSSQLYGATGVHNPVPLWKQYYQRFRVEISSTSIGDKDAQGYCRFEDVILKLDEQMPHHHHHKKEQSVWTPLSSISDAPPPLKSGLYAFVERDRDVHSSPPSSSSSRSGTTDPYLLVSVSCVDLLSGRSVSTSSSIPEDLQEWITTTRRDGVRVTSSKREEWMHINPLLLGGQFTFSARMDSMDHPSPAAQVEYLLSMFRHREGTRSLHEICLYLVDYFGHHSANGSVGRLLGNAVDLLMAQGRGNDRATTTMVDGLYLRFLDTSLGRRNTRITFPPLSRVRISYHPISSKMSRPGGSLKKMKYIGAPGAVSKKRTTMTKGRPTYLLTPGNSTLATQLLAPIKVHEGIREITKIEKYKRKKITLYLYKLALSGFDSTIPLDLTDVGFYTVKHLTVRTTQEGDMCLDVTPENLETDTAHHDGQQQPSSPWSPPKNQWNVFTASILRHQTWADDLEDVLRTPPIQQEESFLPGEMAILNMIIYGGYTTKDVAEAKERAGKQINADVKLYKPHLLDNVSVRISLGDQSVVRLSQRMIVVVEYLEIIINYDAASSTSQVDIQEIRSWEVISKKPACDILYVRTVAHVHHSDPYYPQYRRSSKRARHPTRVLFFQIPSSSYESSSSSLAQSPSLQHHDGGDPMDTNITTLTRILLQRGVEPRTEKLNLAGALTLPAPTFLESSPNAITVATTTTANMQWYRIPHWQWMFFAKSIFQIIFDENLNDHVTKAVVSTLRQKNLFRSLTSEITWVEAYAIWESAAASIIMYLWDHLLLFRVYGRELLLLSSMITKDDEKDSPTSPWNFIRTLRDAAMVESNAPINENVERFVVYQKVFLDPINRGRYGPDFSESLSNTVFRSNEVYARIRELHVSHFFDGVQPNGEPSTPNTTTTTEEEVITFTKKKFNTGIECAMKLVVFATLFSLNKGENGISATMSHDQIKLDYFKRAREWFTGTLKDEGFYALGLVDAVHWRYLAGLWIECSAYRDGDNFRIRNPFIPVSLTADRVQKQTELETFASQLSKGIDENIASMKEPSTSTPQNLIQSRFHSKKTIGSSFLSVFRPRTVSETPSTSPFVHGGGGSNPPLKHHHSRSGIFRLSPAQNGLFQGMKPRGVYSYWITRTLNQIQPSRAYGSGSDRVPWGTFRSVVFPFIPRSHTHHASSTHREYHHFWVKYPSPEHSSGVDRHIGTFITLMDELLNRPPVDLQTWNRQPRRNQKALNRLIHLNRLKTLLCWDSELKIKCYDPHSDSSEYLAIVVCNEHPLSGSRSVLRFVTYWRVALDVFMPRSFSLGSQQRTSSLLPITTTELGLVHEKLSLYGHSSLSVVLDIFPELVMQASHHGHHRHMELISVRELELCYLNQWTPKEQLLFWYVIWILVCKISGDGMRSIITRDSRHITSSSSMLETIQSENIIMTSDRFTNHMDQIFRGLIPVRAEFATTNWISMVRKSYMEILSELYGYAFVQKMTHLYKPKQLVYLFAKASMDDGTTQWTRKSLYESLLSRKRNGTKKQDRLSSRSIMVMNGDFTLDSREWIPDFDKILKGLKRIGGPYSSSNDRRNYRTTPTLQKKTPPKKALSTKGSKDMEHHINKMMVFLSSIPGADLSPFVKLFLRNSTLDDQQQQHEKSGYFPWDELSLSKLKMFSERYRCSPSVGSLQYSEEVSNLLSSTSGGNLLYGLSSSKHHEAIYDDVSVTIPPNRYVQLGIGSQPKQTQSRKRRQRSSSMSKPKASRHHKRAKSTSVEPSLLAPIIPTTQVPPENLISDKPKTPVSGNPGETLALDASDETLTLDTPVETPAVNEPLIPDAPPPPPLQVMDVSQSNIGKVPKPFKQLKQQISDTQQLIGTKTSQITTLTEKLSELRKMKQEKEDRLQEIESDLEKISSEHQDLLASIPKLDDAISTSKRVAELNAVLDAQNRTCHTLARELLGKFRKIDAAFLSDDSEALVQLRRNIQNIDADRTQSIDALKDVFSLLGQYTDVFQKYISDVVKQKTTTAAQIKEQKESITNQREELIQITQSLADVTREKENLQGQLDQLTTARDQAVQQSKKLNDNMHAFVEGLKKLSLKLLKIVPSSSGLDFPDGDTPDPESVITHLNSVVDRISQAFEYLGKENTDLRQSSDSELDRMKKNLTEILEANQNPEDLSDEASQEGDPLDQLKKFVLSLKASLTIATTHSEQLSTLNEQLTNSQREYTVKIREMKDQLSTLSNEKAQIQLQLDKLSIKMEELRQSHNANVHEIADLKKVLRTSLFSYLPQDKNDDGRKVEDDVGTNIEKFKQWVTRLKEENTRLTKEMEGLRTDLHSATTNYSVEQNRAENLSEQLTSLTEQKETLQKENATHQRKIQDLEFQINQLRQTMDELQTNAQTSKRDTENRLSELNQQSELLAQAFNAAIDEDYDHLQQSLQDKSTVSATLKDKIAQIKQLSDNLNKVTTTIDQEKTNLSQQEGALKQLNHMLSDQLKKLDGSISDEMTTLQGHVTEIIDKLHQLITFKDGLSETLDEHQNLDTEALHGDGESSPSSIKDRLSSVFGRIHQTILGLKDDKSDLERSQNKVRLLQEAAQQALEEMTSLKDQSVLELGKIKKQVASQQRTIQEHTKNEQRLREEIKSLMDVRDPLAQKLTKLKQKLQQYSDEKTQLSAQIQSLSEKIEPYKQTSIELSDKVSQHAQNAESLQRQLKEKDQQITQQQKEIDGLQTMIEEKMKHYEVVVQQGAINEKTLRESQSALTEAEMKINSLDVKLQSSKELIRKFKEIESVNQTLTLRLSDIHTLENAQSVLETITTKDDESMEELKSKVTHVSGILTNLSAHIGQKRSDLLKSIQTISEQIIEQQKYIQQVNEAAQILKKKKSEAQTRYDQLWTDLETIKTETTQLRTTRMKMKTLASQFKAKISSIDVWDIIQDDSSSIENGGGILLSLSDEIIAHLDWIDSLPQDGAEDHEYLNSGFPPKHLTQLSALSEKLHQSLLEYYNEWIWSALRGISQYISVAKKIVILYREMSLDLPLAPPNSLQEWTWSEMLSGYDLLWKHFTNEIERSHVDDGHGNDHGDSNMEEQHKYIEYASHFLSMITSPENLQSHVRKLYSQLHVRVRLALFSDVPSSGYLYSTVMSRNLDASQKGNDVLEHYAMVSEKGLRSMCEAIMKDLKEYFASMIDLSAVQTVKDDLVDALESIDAMIQNVHIPVEIFDGVDINDYNNNNNISRPASSIREKFRAYVKQHLDLSMKLILKVAILLFGQPLYHVVSTFLKDCSSTTTTTTGQDDAISHSPYARYFAFLKNTTTNESSSPPPPPPPSSFSKNPRFEAVMSKCRKSQKYLDDLLWHAENDPSVQPMTHLDWYHAYKNSRSMDPKYDSPTFELPVFSLVPQFAKDLLSIYFDLEWDIIYAHLSKGILRDLYEITHPSLRREFPDEEYIRNVFLYFHIHGHLYVPHSPMEMWIGSILMWVSSPLDIPRWMDLPYPISTLPIKV